MTNGMLQPSEQQRRQMLREMGLTPWFPRGASATAAPSHEMIFSLEDEPVALDSGVPEPVADNVTESAGSTRSTGNPGALNQARQLLSDADNKTNEQKGRSPAGEITPPAGQPAQREFAPSNNTQNTESVAFNFTWVNVDDRLALLAMMPETETRIPAVQRDMMKRMLVALDPGIDTSNLRAKLFCWPMPGLAIQDSASATSAVNGFVAKQLNDRPVANLLVLSSSVPVFLPSSIQPGQLSAWEPLSVDVLCTHAMHEMVGSPSIKRVAWQHMQVIRQRLTSGQEKKA